MEVEGYVAVLETILHVSPELMSNVYVMVFTTCNQLGRAVNNTITEILKGLGGVRNGRLEATYSKYHSTSTSSSKWLHF